MKKIIIIIGIIMVAWVIGMMAFSVTYAQDAPKPTKEQLAAQYDYYTAKADQARLKAIEWDQRANATLQQIKAMNAPEVKPPTNAPAIPSGE